jgi:hypothetical protein
VRAWIRELDPVDRLFLYFVSGLFLILILYGGGMMLVVIFGDQALSLRLVSGFASMFAAVLGFGSGFLLARHRQREGGSDR